VAARLASLDHVTKGFATPWLSGLNNAGKPKHSFVNALCGEQRALTRSPRRNKRRHLKILASGSDASLEVQTERIGH
jgi:hypothetical protein